MNPLADAVQQRRLELGITQEDVVMRAREAGEDLSLGTVRNIEQGATKGLRRKSKQGLAAGLDWRPEHIDHLTTGRSEPTCSACARRPVEEKFGPEVLDQLDVEAFASLDPDERVALMTRFAQWMMSLPEPAAEEEITDPVELEIWNLTTIPEDARRNLIAELRRSKHDPDPGQEQAV